ncbi:TonB family protein [Methylophilaceae bacterium]|nr:TonB family protein [Methylophilaceae bacterium]
MKILKSNYFTIFFIISMLLHGTLFYFFNIKSNEVINDKELIVNILKIPNQVTNIEVIDLKKEEKPVVIKKIKQDQKKFQQQIIQETKEPTNNLTQESTQDKIVEQEKPKTINLDPSFIQSQLSNIVDKRKIDKRTKVISSKTKERDYQSYYQVWKNKVEKIGALNYPAAARNGISESLVMTVILNDQGEVLDIKINKSSGVPQLDDAAKKIVNLGSPYSPFPPSIKEQVDTLQIRRIWRFTNNLME